MLAGSLACQNRQADHLNELQKSEFIGCGGWDRTTGLQVMSLTSYHCSTPRYIFPVTYFRCYLSAPPNAFHSLLRSSVSVGVIAHFSVARPVELYPFARALLSPSGHWLLWKSAAKVRLYFDICKFLPHFCHFRWVLSNNNCNDCSSFLR